MRRPRTPQAESPRRFFLRLRCATHLRRVASIPVAIVALAATVWLLAGAMLAAQPAPAAASPAAPAVKPHRMTAARNRPAQATAPVPPQPAPAPPAPKPPDWPVNEVPSPANVVWDSHGLLVVASNSSLKQILKDISVDTGTKIEGINQDERIFGTYGPGPARDVISQLLDGSNYDVLMIGDQGQGTPRQVVLTLHSGGAAPPGGNANPTQPSDQENGDDQAQQPDDSQPEPPQAEQPRLNPNNAAPPVPARTQQQLIEEMQERQRQLQQMQQQQQNPQ